MQRVGHVLNVDGKQRYRMEAGDILFSHINSLPHMGKTAYFEGDVELYHGMNLLLLRAKESVNSRFLYYQLNTPKNIARYQVIANRAVNQASINTKTLAGITLFLPSVSEQQRISSFFKLLDQKLETQIRVIEDLKTLKAALCELLYDEREPNYLIGEIIEQTSIRNRNGENLKVLSVSNQLGFIDQSEQFEGRTIASQDTSNYKVVSLDDFAYNPARINVGSIARLKDFEKGIVSPMYICFRCKNGVLPGYLESFFDTDYFYIEMEKRLEGSVRMCLSYEGLCNIPIAIPNIQEQKSIGQKIQVLKEKIKLEESIYKHLSSQKQILLSQLFI